MPQKEILGWTSSDKFPTLWTEYPVFGFGSRIWEKTVMIKKMIKSVWLKKIVHMVFQDALAQRMIETKEILLAAWAGRYGQNAPKTWGCEGLEHGRCCSVWTWCSFKSFGSLYLQPATSATGGDVESVRGMWVLYWNGSRTWSQKAC